MGRAGTANATVQGSSMKVHPCINAGKHASAANVSVQGAWGHGLCIGTGAHEVNVNALAQVSMGAQPVHRCVKQRVTSFVSVAINSDHWICHYLTHLTSHKSSPPLTESSEPESQ